MRKLRIDEIEFSALVLLLLWTLAYAKDVTEQTVEFGDRQKRQVYEELHSYYTKHGREDFNYAHRFAMITSMVHAVDVCHELPCFPICRCKFSKAYQTSMSCACLTSSGSPSHLVRCIGKTRRISDSCKAEFQGRRTSEGFSRRGTGPGRRSVWRFLRARTFAVVVRRLRGSRRTKRDCRKRESTQ